jgi:hypothetical protein
LRLYEPDGFPASSAFKPAVFAAPFGISDGSHSGFFCVFSSLQILFPVCYRHQSLKPPA